MLVLEREYQFPSPKGGGPIEGGRTSCWFWSANTSFHRRKAVAPLKEITYRRSLDGTPGFHRRKAVAPLKADGVGLAEQPGGVVSIAERRWPH